MASFSSQQRDRSSRIPSSISIKGFSSPPLNPNPVPSAIRRITRQAGADNFLTKIPNKAGLVIGKGGQTMKNMQGRTGARTKQLATTKQRIESFSSSVSQQQRDRSAGKSPISSSVSIKAAALKRSSSGKENTSKGVNLRSDSWPSTWITAEDIMKENSWASIWITAEIADVQILEELSFLNWRIDRLDSDIKKTKEMYAADFLKEEGLGEGGSVEAEFKYSSKWHEEQLFWKEMTERLESNIRETEEMSVSLKNFKEEVLRDIEKGRGNVVGMSDLYNAYKGPEDKKESVVPSDSAETAPTNETLKQLPAEATSVDTAASGKSVPSKTEPDDWEDAADISTPKLEPSGGESQSSGRLVGHDEDLNENMSKMYSRDFLMKFCDQCTELPDGFGIASDIADVLMSTHLNSFPSPGRMTDRQSGAPRMDGRGGVMLEDDRWGRMSAPSSSGRDVRLDIGYGANVRLPPGQGGNIGVLRNAQMIMQYGGGILPMQAMGPQGVRPRNSPDADRWQCATNFQQKGLIPSPNTPLQKMHKAVRKYEIGKVADEEEAKQRQLKAILSKLTPQNFEKLFEQVKAVNIDNAVTLKGVINQIFDKALMEPTFCEMYANFCYYLADELLDFYEDNEKITFKRLLLNKCQEEFECAEREHEEADKDNKKGEVKQTAKEKEEKRVKAHRRMLGNIRHIGELYKKKMLIKRIMQECIKKLLGQYKNPDEEDVESLCKLMSTIGQMIDHPKAKEHMDVYFDRMTMLSNDMKLSSRVRFMLKDAIELRKNKWQHRRKVEGPKRIEEVHRDAAQERQAQTSRLTRGSSMNSSYKRGPMDYALRGSAMLASPTSQMGRGSALHVNNTDAELGVGVLQR